MTVKVFSPDITKTNQHCSWRVARLDSNGIVLMNRINHDLDGTAAKHVSEWINITPSELRRMSGVPNTTFNHSVRDCFTADQSERLVRIIRVIERAVGPFEGDKEAAHKWLNKANRGLSWKSPAELVSSEIGALEVMRLVTYIRHGVYS